MTILKNNEIPALLMISTIIFMDILTGMEFDLFVPSFSQLQAHFHLTPFWVEALLSINFIGYLISLFIVGYVSDRYGRKNIIIFGLVIFVLGSVACVSAASYEVLLLGRFLQGLGIAAPSILSFLIIADRYPIKKQQFFMAILNGSLNIAAGIAPVIGSFVALYFHWRDNFALLIMLGLVALLMTCLFIPRHTITKEDEKIDSGYIALFKSKPLLLLMFYFAVTFVPYWIFVGVSPLLYVKSLHIHLSVFGYYQGILAFAFAIGSIIFGFALRYASQRKWLILGLIIYILSFVAIGFVSFFHAKDALWITLAMLVFVIGQIAPDAILYPLCLNTMPQAKAKISAVIQADRLLLAVLSLQITGYLYSGTFLQTGILIMIFIAAIVVTQLMVMRNKKLMVQKS